MSSLSPAPPLVPLAPRSFGRRMLGLLGIDRAIGYTLLSRVWGILATPLTLWFVARTLTPEEQGFYYTFGNVVGLQIFFELGLASVIMQFASHEKAGLDWTPHHTLHGDRVAKARLSSLLSLSLRWYSVVALLALGCILPVGFWFFAHQAPGVRVAWHAPWLWTVLITATSLLTVPFYAVLEGCGRISEVVQVQWWGNIASALMLWGVLLLGGKLFASPAAATLALVMGALILGRKRGVFFKDLLRHRDEADGADTDKTGDAAANDVAAEPIPPSATPRQSSISWREEVWPFQWKLALSWASGYFLFQLFNPVLFAFRGPAEAGRMGMSLGIMSAIWATALAWVTTKAAPFGSLIARRDFQTLDREFFPCLWQSFGLTLFSGLAFWGAALVLRLHGNPVALRLLDPLPLGLMVAALILNQPLVSQAIYLRAHKEEPFLWLSLGSAVLAALCTFVLGRAFGATGMMAGYLAVTLISLGVGNAIFQRKRREWHSAPAEQPVEQERY